MPTETALSEPQDLTRTSVVILAELEDSLLSCQKALLAHDISGIEQETLNQQRLQQTLEALWTGSMAHSQDGNSSQEFSRPKLSSQPAELRAAKARVLHLGRVQLALLSRAQRSMNTVLRLLAGPGASYGPPACTKKVRISRT
jgi:hypothetical protein